MMKSGIRILAIEDSPFNRMQKECMLIGVVGRPDVIEGILSFKVKVDGSDSTGKIIKGLKGSRFIDQVKLIALNGNTVAGMNIIDMLEVSRKLKMPVIAITRTKPHPSLLKRAIKLALPKEYRKKAELIDRMSRGMDISKASGFYVQCIGANPKEVKELVEPAVKMLRLGHIIASGVAKGESTGRL
jgi:uncharacterized protein